MGLFVHYDIHLLPREKTHFFTGNGLLKSPKSSTQVTEDELVSKPEKEKVGEVLFHESAPFSECSLEAAKISTVRVAYPCSQEPRLNSGDFWHMPSMIFLNQNLNYKLSKRWDTSIADDGFIASVQLISSSSTSRISSFIDCLCLKLTRR